MNRSILALAIALVVVAPSAALAQAPTPAQLEKAKKAFGEGKKMFEAGDFPEAIAKFKESYNLSKKPTLLYNIALSNQSAGQDDIALFYFRKFLTEADPADAQRPDAEARTKELEKKFGGGGTNNTTNTQPDPVKTEPVKPPPVKAEPAKPIKIKPPGTYKPEDFQHIIVDTAPPKKPLDVTASVPEDSGWVVTLHFRTAGEGKFTSKEMKWRYKELIARVPPEKMLGDSMQYYIEVKDQAGAVVTRSAKSTSPNLVTLEAGATARFYPDWSEDAGTVATPEEQQQSDTEENPLNRNKKRKQERDVDTFETPDGPAGPGNGFGDVGSKKFNYMKWGSTGATVVFAGLSVLMYVSAGNQARALEDDIVLCGQPPCREFNQYAKDVEAAGKRNQTLSRVTLVFGVGSAAIAGYFWYKQMKAKPRTEVKLGKVAGPAKAASSVQVVPAIGEGFAGAVAGFEF